MDELYPCVAGDELPDGVIVRYGSAEEPPSADIEDVRDEDRMEPEADVAHEDGGGAHKEHNHEDEIAHPMALVEGGCRDGVSQVIEGIELDLRAAAQGQEG